MDQMKVFQMIYVNDLSLKLLQGLTTACAAAGITVREAALRWLMHHSPLNDKDGIIIGGSSEAQLEANLRACEGAALPQTVLDSFEHMSKAYRAAGKDSRYSV